MKHCLLDSSFIIDLLNEIATVAMTQRRSARRMGESDAWQAAIAEQVGATIVGHDPKAFKRLGADYSDLASRVM
jgi:predicted nucleic acid-binding protein